MSNDYLSSLPEDMLEEISKFFDALAQTCKSLRAHFQRHLFSNVELTDQIRVLAFAELVEANPLLTSYIQTILLEADQMYMGLFQYPPLLAIIHAAASSSGTLPEIHLCIELSYQFLEDELPVGTFTHILDAPQNILDAITDLNATLIIESPIPVGLFKLLPNLRQFCGYVLILSSIFDNNPLTEDHTPEFFRPKLDELMLSNCSPAIITTLCEQSLDLSAVKNLEVFPIQLENTSMVYANSKFFLAQSLLDRAQSVQKLHLDIGVMVDPFYDLGRLQRLRECTLDIDVEAGNDPVPHLTQLLRTLPPLPEHDLKHLFLTLKFTQIPPDTKHITVSQVLFSLSTWSEFDAALDDVGASGTRPFELTLWFFTDARILGFFSTPAWLKDMFVD
ncbi:hypothetical protein BDN70DRAFT_926414 [Pholiota conissans]|uniref:F-box domain-containing protein n=1 Tax=Pholiota conissans TaxID=109636 RepID=A0A9P5YKS4_9AGAR|nr:hypothetical protein BDN70DRAFT_926414 [Pholiota conissans]